MGKLASVKTKGFVLAAVSTFIVAAAAGSAVYAAPPTVDLGAADPFAILAGTPNITDAGNSSEIEGNVGLSPAAGSAIGLTCAQVNGFIYSVDATGPLPCRVTNAPLMTTAKNDLITAYDDAAGRTPATTVPTELGGTTVVAGVYDSVSTAFEITAGAGPLVLDGQDDPSSVFIFQAGAEGTGLTVGPGSTISLENGAQACNVFWQVDTADIDTTAVFKGTILALNSITVANGADIEGRLLARNGSVTLINDTIRVPACTTPTAPGDGSSDGDGSGAGSGGQDDTTAGIVPGFPNTGFFSGSNLGWAITLGLSVISGVLIASVYRKKRTI